jgi:hypothetical protein
LDIYFLEVFDLPCFFHEDPVPQGILPGFRQRKVLARNTSSSAGRNPPRSSRSVRRQ